MDRWLDLGEPLGQVLAIILFLIPGLNATWVVERLEGRSTLPVQERLFRTISWSVVVHLLAAPYLLSRSNELFHDLIRPSVELLVTGAGVLFVAPVFLALALVWLRRRAPFRRIVRALTHISPSPAAWDFVFSTLGPTFVRVRLRDGGFVGGLFARHSFASAFPQPQSLFIERAWRLSRKGEFVQPVPGNRGILLHADMIDVVEFLRVV